MAICADNDPARACERLIFCSLSRESRESAPRPVVRYRQVDLKYGLGGPQHEKKVTGIDGGRICALPRRAENPICQNLATAQNAYCVSCIPSAKVALRVVGCALSQPVQTL